MGNEHLANLAFHHPIISCEGTAEEVMMKKLVASDFLIFPKEHVIAVIRSRTAKSIQEEFLCYDYDYPVCVVRVLDSRSEKFKLGPLYRERFDVLSAYTHPENEMLAIIREGKYQEYCRRYKSKMKPSEYCKQVLGMKGIKSAKFLEGYWDAGSIAEAAREYRRLTARGKDELFVADLLR